MILLIVIHVSEKSFFIDINECTEKGSRALCQSGICVNTPGSFRCDCPSGFRLGKGGSCVGKYFSVDFSILLSHSFAFYCILINICVCVKFNNGRGKSLNQNQIKSNQKQSKNMPNDVWGDFS